MPYLDSLVSSHLLGQDSVCLLLRLLTILGSGMECGFRCAIGFHSSDVVLPGWDLLHLRSLLREDGFCLPCLLPFTDVLFEPAQCISVFFDSWFIGVFSEG